MAGYSLIPEIIGAGIVLLGAAWFFEDRISFNKGMLLGPYEWLLKTAPYYFPTRRSVSDVTAEIFQNQKEVFDSIREEVNSPYFTATEESKDYRTRIQAIFKKVDKEDILSDPNFQFQAFVLGSLLHGRMLVYVISRKRDEKTSVPTPFPSGQALARKRPVLTSAGFQSRRLIEGPFVVLQNKQRIRGLLPRPTRVGLFVPDEDAKDPKLVTFMEKLVQPLHYFAAAIRTERQYGVQLKDTQKKLDKANSEVKRLTNELRTLAGQSAADRRTTEWYKKNLPGGNKITRPMTPVVMFLFPIIGAVAVEYGFRSNAIIGVILGSALAIMLIGVRGAM